MEGFVPFEELAILFGSKCKILNLVQYLKLVQKISKLQNCAWKRSLLGLVQAKQQYYNVHVQCTLLKVPCHLTGKVDEFLPEFSELFML